MRVKKVFNGRKAVKSLLPILGYLFVVLALAEIVKEMLLHILLG